MDVAYQAPLSMAFFREEYWSGLPFPSPGDLPNPGIEPGSPAMQADALPSEPHAKYLKRGRRASGTARPTGHCPYINHHYIFDLGRLRASALPAVMLGGPGCALVDRPPEVPADPRRPPPRPPETGQTPPPSTGGYLKTWWPPRQKRREKGTLLPFHGGICGCPAERGAFPWGPCAISVVF